MSEIRTPECKCLDCGSPIDSAGDLEAGNIPSEGDITICIKCGHIMAFDSELRVRPLIDQEIIDVAGDRNILRVQKAIGYVRNIIEEEKRKKK